MTRQVGCPFQNTTHNETKAFVPIRQYFLQGAVHFLKILENHLAKMPEIFFLKNPKNPENFVENLALKRNNGDLQIPPN